MEGFSLTDHKMERFAADVEERQALQPADPWPAEERTEARRAARIRNAVKSFAYFDRTYFPPEMYSDGYSDPGRMHREILKAIRRPGVDVVLGPRSHGKTVTAKKVAAWMLLTGEAPIVGTYSHTLPTASNILQDIVALIAENPRIVDDFRPEFTEANKEQAQLRTKTLAKWRYVAAFSDGKSVRGFSRMFGRPKVIIGDDIETLTSPLGADQSSDRIRRVAEAYLSLTEDGSFLWLANNFDSRCATNRLLEEQEAGDLDKNWRVHVFDVWNEKKGEPLWIERFGRISIEELRERLRPRDHSDWSGNFRQKPLPPDGHIFPRDHYDEYDHLPPDVRGVIYCDPNLALKGKGDKTAIVAYLYSPETDRFYLADFVLKSFSGSNALLDHVLNIRAGYAPGVIIRVGFDGNVTQESTWTNNVRNWCRINQAPFPHIEYVRANVDLLAKNLQAAWQEGRVRFPLGMKQTEQGREAVDSLCTFAGKKAGRRDDFPDALINAHDLLCGTGFARPQSTSSSSGFEVITSGRRF